MWQTTPAVSVPSRNHGNYTRVNDTMTVIKSLAMVFFEVKNVIDLSGYDNAE